MPANKGAPANRRRSGTVRQVYFTMRRALPDGAVSGMTLDRPKGRLADGF
jgi:hypothetical protein